MGNRPSGQFFQGKITKSFTIIGNITTAFPFFAVQVIVFLNMYRMTNPSNLSFSKVPGKVIKSGIVPVIALLLIFIINSLYAGQLYACDLWKAGVSKMVITPEEPIWMAGYASRDRPSEGVMHDLWAKALVLEDCAGKKVLLITTDLLGFPGKMSDNIRDRIAAKYGFERAEIILSSSHTHTGPVLMDALFDIYPLDTSHIEIIRRYSHELENKIVELTGKAIYSLNPAHMYSGNGIVRFQVNRRNNNAATLFLQTELKGPNDHSVPVIKVTDTLHNPVALVFGYACHTTVLDNYLFSGDYAGFAQIELENLYPGATAMFFQGAGADQNPLPRRTVPLAEQYGKELAAAVDRVLKEEMKNLKPHIATAYSEIDLAFSSLPGKEALMEIKTQTTGYQQRWAASQLKRMENKEPAITSYPYPVQVWKLGDQPIMIMGGEPVIEYAIQLKRIFGHEIFVMGYANDIMGYIPSETILEEGEYEGEISQMVYGLPAKWNKGIQERILDEFRKLSIYAGMEADK